MIITTNILDKLDSVEDKSENKERGIKLQSGKATKIDLAADFDIAPDEPFAYHYKLYPKGNHSAPPIYMLDPGNIINEAQNTHNAYDVYNIVTDRAPSVSKGGAMKLIIPDCHNVIWKYDDNKDETKAINYWWGLSAEVIDVIYSQNLPIGTQKLLTMLKRAIATGEYHPFSGILYSQNGMIQSDPDKILSPEEIITMDWLADNVIGTIPKSRELKEQAKPVTLQSGVESQKG